MKEETVELPQSDLDLLRQGKIRAVGKVRARKLRKKGVACWWSPQLHSLVWAFSLNKEEHE